MDYCWLPDSVTVWRPARLVSSTGGISIFHPLEGSKEPVAISSSKALEFPHFPPSVLTASLDNLVELQLIDEGSVLLHLRRRYQEDKIYTAVGDILLSVNPFKELAIYTDRVIEQYRSDLSSCSPHVYSIAASAYLNIQRERKNQAVIISGESGAGKIKNNKQL